MRKLYFIGSMLAIALLPASNAIAQPLTGTYTLPGTVNGTTVNNLTQLATLLNVATVNGTAVFEFTSSYAGGETYPITFNQFAGTGNVVIRPDASVSSALITSGAPASAALLDLNGVKHLTFDGRPGGTGTAIDWLFQNTANGGSYPAFRFITGAVNDTLQYLDIQSSGTNTTGTVVFSTCTVAGGNSNNVIQNNNIYNYSAYPYNPVLSAGTVANANANNSILNNNIYNFQGYYASGPYGGINITGTGSGSNWTISGNSLYCTSATGFYYLTAICFLPGTASTGNIITGNYVGGTQDHCGGTPWNFKGYDGYTYSPDFQGIYVNSGGTTQVTNNTISNIRLSGTTSQSFCGINIGSSSAANVDGNTIGSPTDTNSIHEGAEGVTIGIWHQSSGAVTINNNIIANLTSDNGFPATGYTFGDVIGIFGYSSSSVLGGATITNNQIFNLTTSTNQNINQYYPINGGGGVLGGAQISSQTNIMAGISVQSAGSGVNTISKNTVYGLHTTITGGTSIAYIYGIVDNAGSGSSNAINGNLVYGLYAPNNYGTSGTYYIGLTGIYLPTSFSGTYNVTNNMVDLGYRSSDGTSVQNATISGIWDNDNYNISSLKIHCYHNSVFIGGSDNTLLNSYAFRRALDFSSSAYDSLALKNNILVNNRTSTAASKHYGLYLNSTIAVVSDYNEVYGSGSSFKYGSNTGTDYATLALFQASNSGYETHSLSSDPQYLTPTGATPDLHITNNPSVSPVDQAGTASPTLVYDYDSLVRANYSPVDIGATVVCTSAGNTSVSLTVNGDTSCQGDNIVFTATPTNAGTSPSYAFYINGAQVQSGALATYNTSALNNLDSVWVVMSATGTCVSTNSATSNHIVVYVNSTSQPTVTLGVNAPNACAGSADTFSITTGNSTGATIAYQWHLNNTLVGTNSATYITSALVNNDSVWAVVTFTNICATQPVVTSTVYHATVLPQAHSNVTQSICQGQSFEGHNASGTYTDTLHNAAANGCDSIHTLHLTVLNNATGNISQTICQGQSYNGHNATGTFNDTLHNAAANGCDSISILHLTVLNNAQGSVSQTICQGQSYGGHNANGTYTDTLHNAAANGCDSIRTLNLTVLNSASSNISQTICQGQSYGGHNTNGTFTDTLHNAATNGCDSVVTLALTVLPNSTSTVNQTICEGQTYGGHNTNGTFTDTLHNAAANGCDSVVALTLVVLPNAVSTVTQTVCFGQSFDGHNATGIFIDTLHNAAASGCDSIRTLNLTVSPSITSNISHSICQGQSFEGYSATGTFVDTFPATNGCDSIRTLQLSVQSVIQTTDAQTICAGSTYAGYSQSGTFVDTLHATGGCDSVRTLTLTVLPNITNTVAQTICFGQSYAGHDTSGTFTDTLHGAAANGCDSIVNLTLTVLPEITSTASHTICQGQSFEGHNTSGTFIDTLSSSSNCDSIRTLNLTVVSIYTDTVAHAICQGETFEGHTASGLFVDSLQSSGGCDSIVTLNLTVHPLPTAVISQNGNTLTSTHAASYQWFLANNLISGATDSNLQVTQNGFYAVEVTDSNGCSNRSDSLEVTGVGIDELSSNPALTVFPNPTVGTLNISLTTASATAPIEIKVFDALGRVVINTVLAAQGNSFNTQLQMGSLPQGLFLLQIKQADWTVSKRVVLVK